MVKNFFLLIVTQTSSFFWRTYFPSTLLPCMRETLFWCESFGFSLTTSALPSSFRSHGYLKIRYFLAEWSVQLWIIVLHVFLRQNIGGVIQFLCDVVVVLQWLGIQVCASPLGLAKVAEKPWQNICLQHGVVYYSRVSYTERRYIQASLIGYWILHFLIKLQ